MEKALFDWPIVSQYDVKAKYRLISLKFFGHEVFSAERSLNQPKATHVCIHSINQSNRSISVRLLFLFCSRIFFSRSYENRSNCNHFLRASQGRFKDHIWFSRNTYQECHFTDCTKIHIPSPFQHDFKPWTVCSTNSLHFSVHLTYIDS